MKRLAINIWIMILIIALFFCGAAIANREFPAEFVRQTDELLQWGRENLPRIWQELKRKLTEIPICHLFE